MTLSREWNTHGVLDKWRDRISFRNNYIGWKIRKEELFKLKIKWND